MLLLLAMAIVILTVIPFLLRWAAAEQLEGADQPTVSSTTKPPHVTNEMETSTTITIPSLSHVSNDTKTTTTKSVSLVSGKPTRPIASNGAGTVYVRTNGGGEGTFPRSTLIRSADELRTYYEQNKTVFDLERREDGNGFLDVCDAYDDAYFSKNVLVLVALEEGSGSIRHEIKRVALTSEGDLEITVETILPNPQTADMAQWHLFVQPASGVQDVDVRNIIIKKTYRNIPSLTGCKTWR